ncbi:MULTISPECIES: Pup--protein ligase [Nesterenkonia]|uniref:Pup--protein ligase n=2 Tax=Nesterenkonia TaxID=57494 RepID=A0A839FM39_9MICC|nr:MULTISPECIES: Pup--protein ligase [Nesterenkonia]MBA8920946.1 proteasome accessory factor A [Nesterenkonia jeotgali]NYJ17487.1 proteasome accessory factor A [Nesterenkonia sandarakina]
MDRRVIGVETEFGITHHGRTRRGLPPDEVARYLFRPVLRWGRSSNVFIPNASRLYLDVGSHPEYATAECDDLLDLIASDRAGELIMHDLAQRAEAAMTEDGFDGSVYLFKNNVDSQGNSYGSHENYLIPRTTHFRRLSTILLPFLVTRQIMVGAGRLVPATDESPAHYAFSQRADHMWEGISSATTRSRPIINTRDEPHSDAAVHRRLHVIVGDSNMSETTSLLRYGATDLVLRMVESGVPVGDFELENPIGAIRHISHDITGKAAVKIRNGGLQTAVEIQARLLDRARRFVRENGAHHAGVEQIFELWERTLQAVSSGDHTPIERDIDWAIKKRLLTDVAERGSLPMGHPKLEQLDMAYHDVHPTRGVFNLMAAHGRVSTQLAPERIQRAIVDPPATTRAALRGRFLSTARALGAEHTVDWVHHKLVDRPLEALMLKDPLSAEDPRMDALLDRLGDRVASLSEQTLSERRAQELPLALSERYKLGRAPELAEPPLI